MAGPLLGTEQTISETASGGVISPSMITTKQIAALADSFPPQVNTFIATGSNGTLSAAGIVGGFITRTGPSAAFTDTTDSATNIIGTLAPESPFNTAWLVFINNTTPFNQTIVGGSGVTLAGISVIPANSTGIFLLSYTGAAAVSMTGMAIAANTVGAADMNTAITTVGAGTLTAAAIVGAVITRSGPNGPFTDTTDTAANIIAAIPNPSIGQSWILTYINTSPYNGTLAAGSGVTLSGVASVFPGNSTSLFLVTYTGPGAISIRLLASSLLPGAGSSGVAPVSLIGTLARSISGAGVVPGSTGNDNVIAVYSIPANVFDVAGRGVCISAKGSLGSNANNKRIKIIFNATTAVLGSAVTGGTTVEDTGTITTSGATGGWFISADVFKYGAAASNTQIATSNGKGAGVAHLGYQAPTLTTATESGAILVAITGNSTTVAADIALNEFLVEIIN
jgi:hypothetical protein